MVRTCVIGCGNMGSALIRGLDKAGGHSVIAVDLDPDALAAVEDYCEETTDDLSRASEADVVFVAVKPDIVEAVLDGLDLSADQTLVTIAAGVPTDFVEPRTDATVVRIMPNLAAETRDMATAATGDITDQVREILDDVGEFAEVEEAQMDIATAVNGSGPAFVFYFIKAMTEAAIEGGMDHEEAQLLSAQTFKGAAETVVQDDRTANQLIDAVCSPNGTTIEGMGVLWDSGADQALKDAVAAAERRSKELAADFADD